MRMIDDGDDARRILENVRRRLPKSQYDLWFARARCETLTPTSLVISVPNRFHQEWMASRFRTPVSAAAMEVLGTPIEVRFEVTPTPAPLPASGAPDTATSAPPGLAQGVLHEPAAAAPPAPPPLPAPVPSNAGAAADASADPWTVRLQSHYTFDDFVVGPSNQVAHAAALAVGDDPGNAYNPLFLYGSVGLGKTHLLQAVCQQILRRRPGFRIAYMSCEQFTNEYVSALKNNAPEAFRRRFRNVDMMVVDDIHFLAGKERTQEEFFHTFNALYQLRKQIVVSSDAPPTDIPTLEERLVSRFKWGLVAQIEPPETETRMAILRRKAEKIGMVLPDDVVEYIAKHVRSNIREIEGAITSVRSRAALDRVPVDLSLVRAALAPMLEHDAPPVGLEKIAQVVCGHFSVKIPDLRSKKRTKSISTPRQLVMYLAREETSLSLVEIGEFLGGRDHTTVLYGIQRVADEVVRNEPFRQTVDRLRDRVRAR
jgi:chromosomal replication initiator protein